MHVPILFYAHPFELAIGFVLFQAGIRSFLSGESSPSINDALPSEVLLTFQIVSFLAGVCILIGLPLRTRLYGRMLERVGCLLAAGSYGVYALILGFTLPLALAWSTLSITVAIALAFYMRASAVHKTERTIERTLKAATQATDPMDLMRRIVDARGINEGKEGRS